MRILLILISMLIFGPKLMEGQEYIDLFKQERLKYIQKKSTNGSINFRRDSILVLKTDIHPKFIYELSTNLPIERKKSEKGRIYLLKFNGRSNYSDLETGEAKLHIILKQSESHKENLSSTISLKPSWQTYYIPFETSRVVKAKDLKIVLQFGYRPQELEMKDIEFLQYPEHTTLESVPKTEIKYNGMEADAEWRGKALKRIDRFRKSDFRLRFEGKKAPPAGSVVQVKLVEHEFNWGAAIHAQDVVKKHQRYTQFKAIFNIAVFENDLKIKKWSNPEQRGITLKALDILQEDGIKVKGHVLIWPGFAHLTKEYRGLEGKPEKVKSKIEDYLADIISSTKGKISEWDVVNEAYTNKDLQRITGSEEILYNGFRILERIDPEPKKLINEYGIISKGGIDLSKQDWYYDYAKRVNDSTGGLLDGIGIQSHIGSDLTSPEKVLQILDRYAKLGKNLSISEFTMEVQDEHIQYAYTRDFLIAAFSHPRVSNFLFWGYDGNTHKKATIFIGDKLGPMGQAFFELVHGEWKTDITHELDENLSLEGNGFFGTYKYSYVLEGQLLTGHFQLLKNAPKDIVIKL